MSSSFIHNLSLLFMRCKNFSPVGYITSNIVPSSLLSCSNYQKHHRLIPQSNHKKNDYPAIMQFLRIFALISTALLSSFVASNKDDDNSTLPFGYDATPVVVIDLQASNQTDDHCVTLNDRDFCTAIEYCSLKAYLCQFPNPPEDCGSSTPSCNCSASLGGVPCGCDLTTGWFLDAYIVSPYVYCQDDVIQFEPAERGETNSSLYYIVKSPDEVNRPFEVRWQCPDGEVPTTSGYCTCQAFYVGQECSSCEICNDGDPGEFSWNCPGYSADCNSNFFVSSGAGFHFAVTILCIMMTFMLVFLSPPSLLK